MNLLYCIRTQAVVCVSHAAGEKYIGPSFFHVKDNYKNSDTWK
jgi:hypothetical protein